MCESGFRGTALAVVALEHQLHVRRQRVDAVERDDRTLALVRRDGDRDVGATGQQADGRAIDLLAAGDRVREAGIDLVALVLELDRRDLAVLQADQVAAARDATDGRVGASVARGRDLVPLRLGVLDLLSLEHAFDRLGLDVAHRALAGRRDQLVAGEHGLQLSLAGVVQRAHLTHRALADVGAEQLARALTTRHAGAIVEALRDLVRDLGERRAVLDVLLGGERRDADLLMLGDLAEVAVALVERDVSLGHAVLHRLVDHVGRQLGDLGLLGIDVNTNGRQHGALDVELAQLLAELAFVVEFDRHGLQVLNVVSCQG